jgi:hypothetical protein
MGRANRGRFSGLTGSNPIEPRNERGSSVTPSGGSPRKFKQRKIERSDSGSSKVVKVFTAAERAARKKALSARKAKLTSGVKAFKAFRGGGGGGPAGTPRLSMGTGNPIRRK